MTERDEALRLWREAGLSDLAFPGGKPSIEELERILNADTSEFSVTLKPDGSVEAIPVNAAIRLIRLARAQPQEGPMEWMWIYDSVGGAETNKRVFTDTKERTIFLENVCARGPYPVYRSPPAQAIPEGWVLVRKESFQMAYAQMPGFVALFLTDQVDKGDELLREIQALGAAPKAPE